MLDASPGRSKNNIGMAQVYLELITLTLQLQDIDKYKKKMKSFGVLYIENKANIGINVQL